MVTHETTERTPLLTGTRLSCSRLRLPCILAIETTLPIQLSSESPASVASTINETVRSLSLTSQAAEAALTLLLYLRHLFAPCSPANLTSAEDRHNPWTTPTTVTEEVEKLVDAEWTRLTRQASDEEVDEILWMQFPLEDGSNGTVTVVEAIINQENLQSLSIHLTVIRSISDKWDYGHKIEYQDTTETVNIWTRLEFLATPRVLHALELAFLSIYIAILSQYILNLPQSLIVGKQPPLDWRAVTLITSAFAFIMRRPSKQLATFLLTLLAFAINFPSSPDPKSSSYTLLLFCLSLHIFQLHLPFPPTPILLFQRSRVIPLANILSTMATRIFVPAFIFFLPALLLVSFLLSYSLSDALLLAAFPITTPPAPMQARIAFSLLFSAVLVLLCCLLISLVTIYPTMPSRSHPWDCYTPLLRFQTRKTLLAATLEYARPYSFPAPFNLLHILFVGIPYTFLSLIGQGEAAAWIKNTIQPLIWRCTVLPFSLLMGGFWAWGIFRRRL